MPDNLTPEQRSYAMSRVKGRDTGLERWLRSKLDHLYITYTIYPKDLPGKPDIVFIDHRVAVFVDGDFWHGYQFPRWQGRVSTFWQEKIGKTRARDKSNYRKLRKMGWLVIRIWQHQIKKDGDAQVARILKALGMRVQS